MKREITMSTTAGIAVGIICLLLMLVVQPTSIATASSSKVIIPTPKTRAVFTGHSFASGEEVRTYLFDLYVDPSSNELAATPYSVKTDISWNGTNHTLTVHNEIKKDTLWGHQEIDVKYQCDNDPFLDPDAKCRYVSHTPYKEVTGRKNDYIYFNPIGFFDPTKDGSIHLSVYRRVISSAKIKQLIWEALAKSMKTSIFAAGTAASPTLNQIFTTDTEIVFKVESARDIKKTTDQPVSFYIIPNYGHQVTDINGNTIAMPMERKYSGNSYNETVCTLKLMPGKYTFYTSMMSSLTSTVASKKIPFEVKSHIDPHKAPIIVSPRNQQHFASKEAVPIDVLVPVKFFDKAFAAEVEAEHSRLAAQTPYKPLMKFSLKSHGNDSLVREQRVFGKTGDFRIRARMVYDGKPSGAWSEWRNFHIGGKVIPHFKQGIAISSPVEKNYYTGDIPVAISLPQLKPGSSLRLVLGFQEDTVPENDKPLQAQHFPFSIMSEKFDLKNGQTAFTKKYHRNKLITATKNKPGQFQLQVELSIPGASVQNSTRVFHLAQLGDAATNGQQQKSGKMNLDLPENHGMLNSGVSTKVQKTKPGSLTHVSLSGGEQISGTKFKPTANQNEFKFIRPESGKVYRNKFLVNISVPSSLHDNPTITLELICRPLKKGLLKKRAYTPNTTLLTMPLYSRYKDRVLTTILARNIHSKVFHGINGFSSSEFKIRAIIHTGKTSLTHASGWFKLLYDERTYRQENSNLDMAPGIALVSKLNTFKAPTSVKISVGHLWNSEIDYQIESNNCQFGKKYQAVSLKPKIMTKDETTKILTFFIKKSGCYRVRARNRKTGTGATWSTWCKFTVRAALPKVSNSQSINNLSTSGKKLASAPSSPTQKLEVKGLRTSYKTPARVEIKLIGMSHNPPFEIRYRPSTGGRYINIKKPTHRFSHRNNLASLTLNIKKPGRYQLRFKNNDQKSWTPWKNFTVTGNKISGTGLTPHSIRPKAINPQPEPPGRPTPQRLKLNKISHRTINPQPEPPGRPAVLLPENNSTKTTSLNQTHLKSQMNSHVKPASGISKKSPKTVPRTLPAKNVVITIQTPRERHKYLMTGKSVHITTKISSSTKARLQIQVQKKQKNRFIDIHPRISQHHSHGQTIADFTLNQRGEYRFRVKALAKNGKFSPWRTFLIDALEKHSIMPKPIKPTAPKTSKPATTLHPTLQHIR